MPRNLKMALWRLSSQGSICYNTKGHKGRIHILLITCLYSRGGSKVKDDGEYSWNIPSKTSVEMWHYEQGDLLEAAEWTNEDRFQTAPGQFPTETNGKVSLRGSWIPLQRPILCVELVKAGTATARPWLGLLPSKFSETPEKAESHQLDGIQHRSLHLPFTYIHLIIHEVRAKSLSVLQITPFPKWPWTTPSKPLLKPPLKELGYRFGLFSVH